MSEPDAGQISERRRALQNPYAFIEHLEAGATEILETKRQALASEITASRKLLQDPYAYLDGDGSFGAAPKTMDRVPSRRVSGVAKPTSGVKIVDQVVAPYSDQAIEAKVREIHKQIWLQKDAIWVDGVPSDPVDLLDPTVALALLGYECHLDETLGQFRADGGLVEVAGLIDQSSRTVRISRQFHEGVRSFTAAHELGHAALHKNLGVLHRDRALSRGGLSRDQIEVEADKFATLFLMPAKLVRSVFREIFRSAPFVLTEETSFALSSQSLSELQQRCRSQRDLSRLLANAERYDGVQFHSSLASRFRVSSEAMAIRLEELGLVAA